MIFAYFHTFFLLDLIEYSSVVSGVKSYEKAILQMAEDPWTPGLCTVCSIVPGETFRITAGRNSWMRKKAGCRIDAEELYHPLLTHPVANSLYAEGGILLTGPNASRENPHL